MPEIHHLEYNNPNVRIPNGETWYADFIPVPWLPASLSRVMTGQSGGDSFDRTKRLLVPVVQDWFVRDLDGEIMPTPAELDALGQLDRLDRVPMFVMNDLASVMYDGLEVPLVNTSDSSDSPPHLELIASQPEPANLE